MPKFAGINAPRFSNTNAPALLNIGLRALKQAEDSIVKGVGGTEQEALLKNLAQMNEMEAQSIARDKQRISQDRLSMALKEQDYIDKQRAMPSEILKSTPKSTLDIEANEGIAAAFEAAKAQGKEKDFYKMMETNKDLVSGFLTDVGNVGVGEHATKTDQVTDAKDYSQRVYDQLVGNGYSPEAADKLRESLLTQYAPTQTKGMTKEELALKTKMITRQSDSNFKALDKMFGKGGSRRSGSTKGSSGKGGGGWLGLQDRLREQFPTTDWAVFFGAGKDLGGTDLQVALDSARKQGSTPAEFEYAVNLLREGELDTWMSNDPEVNKVALENKLTEIRKDPTLKKYLKKLSSSGTDGISLGEYKKQYSAAQKEELNNLNGLLSQVQTSSKSSYISDEDRVKNFLSSLKAPAAKSSSVLPTSSKKQVETPSSTVVPSSAEIPSVATSPVQEELPVNIDGEYDKKFEKGQLTPLQNTLRKIGFDPLKLLGGDSEPGTGTGGVPRDVLDDHRRESKARYKERRESQKIDALANNPEIRNAYKNYSRSEARRKGFLATSSSGTGMTIEEYVRKHYLDK